LVFLHSTTNLKLKENQAGQNLAGKFSFNFLFYYFEGKPTKCQERVIHFRPGSMDRYPQSDYPKTPMEHKSQSVFGIFHLFIVKITIFWH